MAANNTSHHMIIAIIDSHVSSLFVQGIVRSGHCSYPAYVPFSTMEHQKWYYNSIIIIYTQVYSTNPTHTSI